MQKRKIALALLTAILLTGCGYDPEVSTISIGKDGNVDSYIVEEFAASYYDAEELRNIVMEDIQQANNELKQTAIALDSYELTEEGILKATVTYENAVAYETFNKETLYVGLWKDALAKGYAVKADMKDEEYHVAVFSEPVNVKVPKNILYVSEGLQLDGKKTVTVTDKEKDIYYIIYE